MAPWRRSKQQQLSGFIFVLASRHAPCAPPAPSNRDSSPPRQAPPAIPDNPRLFISSLSLPRTTRPDSPFRTTVPLSLLHSDLASLPFPVQIRPTHAIALLLTRAHKVSIVPPGGVCQWWRLLSPDSHEIDNKRDLHAIEENAAENACVLGRLLADVQLGACASPRSAHGHRSTRPRGQPQPPC